MTHSPTRRSRDRDPGTVVLIDDNFAAMQLLERELHGVGFAVRISREAGRALRFVRVNPRDFLAIVTDYMLPDADGIQVVKQIRAISPTLPVVLISRRMGPDFAAHGYEAGAYLVMEKPFPSAELVAALRILKLCSRPE